MTDIAIYVESLNRIYRRGARRSGVFGEIEIARNLPPSWAAAYGREATA